MEIFFPIFQFGWLTANSGLIFAIFFWAKLRNGPPEAVKIILLMFSVLSFFIKFQIEKCSESRGIKLVLFFFNFSFINSQPQIIDSLFAIRMFSVWGIISSVGFKPSIPIMELIQYDNLFLIILFILFNPWWRFILFFLKINLYFLYFISSSTITSFTLKIFACLKIFFIFLLVVNNFTL